MARTTAFQYLYANPKNQFGITYNILVENLLLCAKANGIEMCVLQETAGLECDRRAYQLLGGTTQDTVKYLLLLQRSGTDELYALTTRPDDDMLKSRLDSVYGERLYTISICPPELWRQIFGLYVEPLLFEQLASSLSAGSTASSAVSESVLESEARKLYNMLVNVGINRRASDLHILPCSTDAWVLFRIDGVNHLHSHIPKDILEKICNILKNDGKMAVTHPHDPVDGKVRYSPSGGKAAGDGIDLRVSIIPTKAGSDLNVRYLSSTLYSFEQLGMAESNITAYKELLELPSGLVIQVGPTGSGKSTTLYAGLAYVHTSLRNIITAEDPVEILMDGISQIDVSAESKLDFSAALKASLRHDPDVIVVGELRDSETAALAVRAANTGHLVLTSLHTNDSVGAFERLINLGIDSYSLGEVVAAVMGQRLVRRLCPHCRQAYKLSLKSEKARFYRLPEEDREVTLYRARGCVACNNTGYVGRIAINEIMTIDSELRNLVQRHAVRKVIEDHLRKVKFKTMYQDGIDKVLAGVTSLEEMNAYAKDTIAFKG